MSYLEIKKRNNEKYVYFVKKWTTQGKRLVLRKYAGKDNGMISKELFLLKNLELLTQEELSLRKPIWEKGKEITRHPQLIETIEQKAIELNNLIEAKNAQQRMRTEFAKEFIYNSNNIEGSRIPKEKLVELFEKGSTSHSNQNEIVEVKNSIRAIDYLENKLSFTLKSIKRLYYILTDQMTMENGLAYPNGFKKTANIVGNSPTTEPEKVELELNELLQWNKKNQHQMYPLERAFEFHCRYERIHPFQDGNGRTGRLIMNKILLQNNYPPMIVYKENKTAYFRSIENAQQGNKMAYYQFMLEQTQKTYDQLLQILRRT